MLIGWEDDFQMLEERVVGIHYTHVCMKLAGKKIHLKAEGYGKKKDAKCRQRCEARGASIHCSVV